MGEHATIGFAPCPCIFLELRRQVEPRPLQGAHQHASGHGVGQGTLFFVAVGVCGGMGFPRKKIHLLMRVGLGRYVRVGTFCWVWVGLGKNGGRRRNSLESPSNLFISFPFCFFFGVVVGVYRWGLSVEETFSLFFLPPATHTQTHTETHTRVFSTVHARLGLQAAVHLIHTRGGGGKGKEGRRTKPPPPPPPFPKREEETDAEPPPPPPPPLPTVHSHRKQSPHPPLLLLLLLPPLPLALGNHTHTRPGPLPPSSSSSSSFLHPPHQYLLLLLLLLFRRRGKEGAVAVELTGPELPEVGRGARGFHSHRPQYAGDEIEKGRLGDVKDSVWRGGWVGGWFGFGTQVGGWVVWGLVRGWRRMWVGGLGGWGLPRAEQGHEHADAVADLDGWVGGWVGGVEWRRRRGVLGGERKSRRFECATVRQGFWVGGWVDE